MIYDCRSVIWKAKYWGKLYHDVQHLTWVQVCYFCQQHEVNLETSWLFHNNSNTLNNMQQLSMTVAAASRGPCSSRVHRKREKKKERDRDQISETNYWIIEGPLWLLHPLQAGRCVCECVSKHVTALHCWCLFLFIHQFINSLLYLSPPPEQPEMATAEARLYKFRDKERLFLFTGR